MTLRLIKGKIRSSKRSSKNKSVFPGIEKLPTGIEGFDQITLGGLPRGRTTLIMGEPGSGKTVFALQTIVNGARLYNEPGIFVALEENSRQIVDNAATFGWNISSLEKEKKLFILDAKISPDIAKSGDFELAGMLAGIKAKASQMGARRIVFDGIDVLLALLDDPRKERNELYHLQNWLSQSGLTGIITGKMDHGNTTMGRYGFMQFMVDCSILFHHRIMERISLREMRVAKYRGSGFAENEFSMCIGSSGIELAGVDAPDVDYKVYNDRVSSGAERLDTMLSGGYLRGSNILISGSPGTAKSTLAGLFIETACRRNEKCIYMSFDEVGSEIVRNMASVGINLAPFVKSGMLIMHSADAETRSAEEHSLILKSLIMKHQPKCLVIDPISAVIKGGGHLSTSFGAIKRLVRFIKSKGITLICASLSGTLEAEGEVEATGNQISAIADTWIHLSYLIRGGERNRALTIIKSRGTENSKQVRELILSKDGITLTDVYVVGGDVLMGTARWEKESAEKLKKNVLEIEVASKRRDLEFAEAEIKARSQSLGRELEAKKNELVLLTLKDKTYAEEQRQKSLDFLLKRGADAKVGKIVLKNFSKKEFILNKKPSGNGR
ncbi:MAG TPA: circadian clock protein KaiC [bacterium]|nr:circadian clock protein KaiC [bacterium]